ncbi:hypothetical protein QTO34_012585 [Cnephaeus nilssonii]|uniref:Uncharacterized protein n=1 Tax=Cnephaeus nilssonii TaxID=3371016 RepID=A0AA40HBB9_CNENI|nr:hypothetical protein QTO34_012585 [Eptesicus nilssonii]
MQVLEESPGAAQGEYASPLVSTWTCGLTFPRAVEVRAPDIQSRCARIRPDQSEKLCLDGDWYTLLITDKKIHQTPPAELGTSHLQTETQTENCPVSPSLHEPDAQGRTFDSEEKHSPDERRPHACELRGRIMNYHLFGTMASLAPVNIFQVGTDEERAETPRLSSFICTSLWET